MKRAMRDDGVTVLCNLPDSMLIHILSFLETKYAVRTSILSTRWKRLWASVENLVFDLPLNMNATSMSSFMNFTDKSTPPPRVSMYSEVLSGFSMARVWN